MCAMSIFPSEIQKYIENELINQQKMCEKIINEKLMHEKPRKFFLNLDGNPVTKKGNSVYLLLILCKKAS